MNSTVPIQFIQADYSDYAYKIAQLRERYLQFPRNISIETQVKCNAKCSFCPYPTSPRKGEEMSTELFYKLLDDLKEIPLSHTFGITLHRINEPLLDRRIREFHEEIAKRFPNAWIQFISNGTSLREGEIEWMGGYKGRLTISLNSLQESEHETLMGFGLKVVLTNLDNLHMLVEKNCFRLPVMLCAPYFDEQRASEFIRQCNERWPCFEASVRPLFQWMGGSLAGNAQRQHAPKPSEALIDPQQFPCGQWFDLHVLANGFVTKCCIDETGYSGNTSYDARVNNVLTIYRRKLSRRLDLPPRHSVAECQDCTHLG